MVADQRIEGQNVVEPLNSAASELTVKAQTSYTGSLPGATSAGTNSAS